MITHTGHPASPAGPAELSRMLVLASLDLDNPDLRQELDTITARTARRLGMPISLVSLVLDTAQLLVGSHGTDGWIAAAHGTPIEWSFCAHAVATGNPYIVSDATADPDHAENPLVTIDGIRSYAGIPLTIQGHTLGAHCVLGTTPHTFTDTDLDELHRSADEITELLDQHRIPAANHHEGLGPTPPPS